MWAQIVCYKNQGIHWYHCNPTFLWQINFRLVRRLISGLIWDISGLWYRSDSWDYREKRIAISRFLTPYILRYVFLGFRQLSIKSDKRQIWWLTTESSLSDNIPNSVLRNVLPRSYRVLQSSQVVVNSSKISS